MQEAADELEHDQGTYRALLKKGAGIVAKDAFHDFPDVSKVPVPGKYFLVTEQWHRTFVDFMNSVCCCAACCARCGVLCYVMLLCVYV